MKLNLGCECCILPTDRWINYDHKSDHPEAKMLDVREGLPHTSGTIEEIYGGNFFDHLTLFEGLKLLNECYRVLAPGGVIRFSVMDTDRIIAYYNAGRMSVFDDLQPPIYRYFSESTKFAVFLLGNLANEQDYTGHRMIYTEESLKEVFMRAGFKEPSFITPDFDQEPWCAENRAYYNHVIYVEAVK